MLYIWVPGGPQPAAIGKAVAERGIDLTKTRVLGQGELTFDEALKGMGDAGLGFITAFHYDHNHQSAKNRKFVTDYNAEFKRNPDMFSAGGYDGMHVIYEALKKTKGDTDGDALIAAAKGMAWESPRGPMSIDPETRDVVQTVYIRRVREGERPARQRRVRQAGKPERPVQGTDAEASNNPGARPPKGTSVDAHVFGGRAVRRLCLRQRCSCCRSACGDARDDELRQSRALHLRDDRRLRHRDLDQPCRVAVFGHPAVSFVAAAAISVVLERTMFNRLYRASDLDQCLLTIGLVFVSVAVAALIYGTIQQPVQLPGYLRGSIQLGGVTLGIYRLFLIVFALVVTLVLVIALEYTRFGAQVRAAVDNQRMARGLGINVDGAFAITFALGSGLAGLGGSLAIDIVGLDPSFALAYLVYVLIVVSVGGLGSIGGSFAAAVVLGISDMAGKYYFPAVGSFLIYLVMITLLMWRPAGIFGSTL